MRLGASRRNLEQGFFEKQGRGVVLTKYGKLFKEYVDNALHSLETG